MKRILITPGEPAGIGPDVTIHAAQTIWDAELVVIADPDLLTARSQQIGLPLTLIACDLTSQPTANPKSTLKYIPVKLATAVIPGKVDIRNSDYVLQTLQIATDCCLKNRAAAVVTGPVNKAVINASGHPFSGHTEFFAQAAQVDRTLMLFVVNSEKENTPPLLVALATTHLPLKEVPNAITTENLSSALAVLHQGLQTYFHIDNPSIFVCGLNPHAGEEGHLGQEEIKIIKPLIQALTKQDYLIEGPFAADTIFLPQKRARADAILAMYHDQALPLVKYASFGHAVNVTLGLPFVRTSVDHGTALDMAATKSVDPSSLYAAIGLAISMTRV